MALDAVLQRFIEHSPVTVMARLALQRAIEPAWLDALFEQHAERQYTRELLFSTTVELMSLVAVGLRPSVHAAAKATGKLPVSTAALYDKIRRTEPGLVRALVAGSAKRLAPVLEAMRAAPAQSVLPGWRLRVVDGNHLPASHKRVGPLRGFRGAALPGQSLVVYDPDSGLVVDLVPCEDAHAQERALMGPILDAAQPGELWLADRNFSTRTILAGWHARQAAFVVREHARTPNPTERGALKRIGRIDTGCVFEQAIGIPDEAGGGELALRRIELRLDAPTDDGDTVVRLLSNAPPEALDACAIAQLYRRRWTIESMFQRLESVLQSEIASLGQPRAALLAFGVAAVAYNVLAVLQASVAAQHALGAADEVSPYYLAGEVRTHYAGMLIAVAASAWEGYERLTAQQLAQALLDIAAHVEPRRFRRHPRAPKPRTKKGYVAGCVARRHVATARVLARGHVD